MSFCRQWNFLPDQKVLALLLLASPFLFVIRDVLFWQVKFSPRFFVFLFFCNSGVEFALFSLISPPFLEIVAQIVGPVFAFFFLVP